MTTSQRRRGRREPGEEAPSTIGDVMAAVLKDAGIASRVEQAAIIPEWATLVGAQIAAVTEPLSIAADGTLFVQRDDERVDEGAVADGARAAAGAEREGRARRR